ncbi:MAG: hypothetical protein JWP81_5014 [Ferruginibacter sp.]|nr:hypothetical protein [Ferruginibacter sp.]
MYPALIINLASLRRTLVQLVVMASVQSPFYLRLLVIVIKAPCSSL